MDGQSIAEFEANLSGSLYKLWNVMAQRFDRGLIAAQSWQPVSILLSNWSLALPVWILKFAEQRPTPEARLLSAHIA